MRRHLAVLALVVALPLFAYPLASPPPDRPDKYTHRVTPFSGPDDLDRLEGIETYRYENLSDRAQTLFESARQGSVVEVGTDEGAPEFNYTDPAGVVVSYRNNTYQLSAVRRSPGPSTDDVLLRLGSLAGSIVLGMAAGYGLVNADG